MKFTAAKRYTLIVMMICPTACSDAWNDKNRLKLPVLPSAVPGPIPEFKKISHIPDKKNQFFEFMHAKIKQANDHVWAEREFVLAYRVKQLNGTADVSEQEAYEALLQRYNLDESTLVDEALFDELLTRVDVVPASLVLAQAANESAWGTSRFAREGRNFFGIWCYREGCGIKPSARKAGSKHEVRKFKSVQDGVNYYTNNINIGHAYGQLRTLRAQLRANGEDVTGIHLANGLVRYSEKGMAYVNEIKAMIKSNELSRYNTYRKMNG